MRAMILAAGLGSRMRPLTDQCPKPLLKVAGKALIDFHLERLESLGIERVAINTHWLSHLIVEHIDQNWRQRLNIDIYQESPLLETAGGIVNALSSLHDNDTPFLLINGDVYFEEELGQWLAQVQQQDCDAPAHLLLCENPAHNPNGDFDFDSKHSQTCGSLSTKTEGSGRAMTYSGIGLFKPSLFENMTPGPAPLGPILKQLAEVGRLHGQKLNRFWLDVGTPERLAQLEQRLSTKPV